MKKASTAVVRRHESQPVVAAPPGSAASLIQAIERAAANPAADIGKMERLYAMHKDMVVRDAENAFNAALARVQAKVVPVVNNAENKHTSSTYAKLAAIDRMLKPLYTAEGLSLSFDTDKADRPDDIKIVAILSHATGHSRKYHIDLPRDESGAQGTKNKTGVQGAGSTNTYGQRYLTRMIFAVVTEDGTDDDGNRKDQVEGLADGAVADHLSAIEAAADIEGLKKAFAAAYTAAQDKKDKPSQRKFSDAKDARKKALGEKK